MTDCLLCSHPNASLYLSLIKNVPWRLYGYAEAEFPKELRFFRCGQCALIFKDPAVRPTLTAEKSHYLKHDNRMDDEAYREYMSGILDPIESELSPQKEILDFGCGYAPVLRLILKAKGITSDSYDPLFYAEQESLDKKYDFILLNEVAEHFFSPKREFQDLFSLLKPKGKIVIRTKFYPEDGFEDWWYMRDPTHVVFYSEFTFRFLADKNHLSYQYISDDLNLFTCST